MSVKANKQLLVLGVLAAVLAAVLYVTAIGDPSPSESGFAPPQELDLVESELMPESADDWQAPENQRNPFIGPFSIQPGSEQPEREESDQEPVRDADSE